jgi:hypothetical protein
MNEFFFGLVALLCLFGISLIVITALSFVAAWVRDLRGFEPDIPNLAAAQETIGKSRWPNLTWRRHTLAAELRSGVVAFAKGIAKCFGWIIGTVMTCLIISFLWSWISGWSIPVAIIVGALIIAGSNNRSP